jgi:hypothetical protein
MNVDRLFVVLAICSALALAACGGSDDEGSGAAAGQATPAEAVKEIGATRAALDRAVDQLRAGDAKRAEETVSEAYLQHFEEVEGPLGKVDAKLNEELEEAISGELRQKIRAGAPVAEVEKLVTEVKADLATAESKLE